MRIPVHKLTVAIATAALFAVVALILIRHIVYESTPDVKSILGNSLNQGRVITDRNGEILRIYPDENGDFRLKTGIDEYSNYVKKAIIIAEDKNFYSHWGVDICAVFRALIINVRYLKIVSGASTITQQLVRIIRPCRRTLYNKIIETLWAIKLESQMTKDEILEAYLNLAPMFGNIRGFTLGARILFAKNVGVLTPAESATLAALPQSPLRLTRKTPSAMTKLTERRNKILTRMNNAGQISADTLASEMEKPVPATRYQLPFKAPHFTEWVAGLANDKAGSTLRTSLDLSIQANLDRAIRSHSGRLAQNGAYQAVGMVVDAETMQILAMSGSLDYSSRAQGFNNGCLSKRSGGSVLKPFLYALAMEQGYTPAYVIPDTSRIFKTLQGDYLPYNATRQAYGPVTIRTALGNSLNISAVKMLNILGIDSFHKFLNDLGILGKHSRNAEYLGLGLAVGNPEIRMLDLVEAYGSFAHMGYRVKLSWKPDPLKKGEKLFSDATAYLILDILSDPSARLLTFGNPRFFSLPFPFAVKTGTSTNYRDQWLIAVMPQYIIALWAGNFDGRSTWSLSGASACGPIFRDLASSLVPVSVKPWFKKPSTITEERVCCFSGLKPTKYCSATVMEVFDARFRPDEFCSFHISENYSHTLPNEYAQWIQARKKTLPHDPFSLSGAFEISDPYSAVQKSGYVPSVRLLHQETETTGGENPCDPMKESSRLIVRKQSLEMERRWGNVKIVYPHDGDRFVILPGRSNFTRFQAQTQGECREIIWFVNGLEIDRTAPPYETLWEMNRGQYVITALTPGEDAAQIMISVE